MLLQLLGPAYPASIIFVGHRNCRRTPSGQSTDSIEQLHTLRHFQTGQ